MRNWIGVDQGNMRRGYLILFFLLLFCFSANAQDFEFGTAGPEELTMQKYDKDTSAHAVVLNEYGRSEIEAITYYRAELVYKYHVKIKIFDKEGIKYGTIEIPFFTNESVDDIKGITTYTNENGTTGQTELDPQKIYSDKQNPGLTILKFAMPALRDGCILEYEYKLTTPYLENFHPWLFQNFIPKIYSEYDIHIPAFWQYNASIKGPLTPIQKLSEVENGCFTINSKTCNCSHTIYCMHDIPAFYLEDYMTAPKNFLSGINFELSDYTDISDFHHKTMTKEWRDADYELKNGDYFGSQLKKERSFKDRIAPVIAGKTDSLDKAKAIYAYIKTLIKWNRREDIGSPQGISKAIDNHLGNTADINLSLVNALNAAGLKTEAVVLSTMEHGVINKLYPVLTEFNYVVAKLNIGNKYYLLDATDPLLPFGVLPLRCLNDQGRVISFDKPSYWIDMDTGQKQNDTYSLDLDLQKDGKIKGKITHYFSAYAGYLKRKEIKKFNSVDEYIENYNEKSTKLKMTNYNIVNLDSVDMPLSETFDLEIKEYDNTDHTRLNFNPYLIFRITDNPFKLAARTYPVDFGVPSSTRFTINMRLPDNYSVDTAAGKAGFEMPNNGASFVTDYEVDGNNFTFSCVMTINRPVFSPVEYPYLKEFFNKIILTEKGDMIFKKN